MTVRRVDPASLPGGLAAAARAAGVAPGDLASNGGVVVEVGGRRRVVDRLQLVSIDRATPTARRRRAARDRAGDRRRARRAARRAPITVCATTGHGELRSSQRRSDADWSVVADRLRGDGMSIETIALDAGVPGALQRRRSSPGRRRRCRRRRRSRSRSFVQRGGGLLVAAASRPVTAASGHSLAPTGLEGLLANVGLGLPAAIAVDPTLTVREMPGALLVVDGYADHEINAGFAQARADDVVPAARGPRERAARGRSSARARRAGASATSCTRRRRRTPTTSAGRSRSRRVGGTHRGRIVAVGSAESFTTAILQGGASAGDLWLAHAVRYLAGKTASTVSVGGRAPDQVRLVMTAGATPDGHGAVDRSASRSRGSCSARRSSSCGGGGPRDARRRRVRAS